MEHHQSMLDALLGSTSSSSTVRRAVLISLSLSLSLFERRVHGLIEAQLTREGGQIPSDVASSSPWLSLLEVIAQQVEKQTYRERAYAAIIVIIVVIVTPSWLFS
jgi:hypothetical protein